MKRIVIATLVAMLLFSTIFAVQTATLSVNHKDRIERIIKESGREIYSKQLSKATAKSVSAYDPAFLAVLIDSSKNGYGLVSGVTNPISHKDSKFVMAYRQWIGMENSSGAIGMAYSIDGGNAWTNRSNLNASSPGALTARYPSAIGAGDYPFICWTEYTGTNSGIENDADPLFVFDTHGFGGGYLTNPQLIGNSNNPEAMWMGCPDYCEESNGTGHVNVTYTTWREFDASGDVSSHNMYLFRSNDITSGAISFQEPIKILDALTYFEEGSANGSTTSDAMISIADNGTGYIASVAYWNSTKADLVENNDYHTFKFRKTTDYGATWSSTSLDTDVPYYYVEDHVFDDNIFDTLNYSGLFIGYDYDMVVDGNGGVHFICLVIPESEPGYVEPTVHEGCGFYHLYCANPASASATWEVSFVTSMQNTWRFSYGTSDRAWQSFFPSMATSKDDPNVIYAVYPKGDIYKEYDAVSGDTLLYKRSYDIFVRKSIDAGATWQDEINVTNTPDFDEICAHADPDATDDHVYLIYQIPDYSILTVGSDETAAVPEDYKCNIYFMNCEISSTQTFSSDFSASPTSGNVPLSVTFTDESTNNPTSWNWNFGDSNTSTDQNPQHTYNSLGAYTVSLTATNTEGNDTEVKNNYITVYNTPPPEANFSASPTTGNAPLSVTFTDESSNNPTSWSWNFGDGTNSTEQNPQYTYDSPGTYTVSLAATNQYGSDTEVKSDYITCEDSDEIFYTDIKFYDNVNPNSNNPNNLINQGIPIRFKLKVRNSLSQNILTGYSVIRSNSNYVTITDSMAAFNNINSETEAWSIDEYEVIISNNCPDASKLDFNIIMRSEIAPTGPWASSFSFPIKPLIIANTYIDDDNNPDSQGNNNDIIEANETIEIIPVISNLSNYSFSDVSGELVSSNSSVVVWNNHSGGSGTIYNSYRYNVVSNTPQTISSGVTNIQPEADYVFDYNAVSTYKFNLTIVFTGYLEGSSKMMFSDIITLNNDYTDLPVGVVDTPEKYLLADAYPNPFNPYTIIGYSLPEYSNLKLVITSISGSIIKQWSISNQQPGWHEVTWDGTDMNGNIVSTGVYIYSLRASDFVDTKKMVFMK